MERRGMSRSSGAVEPGSAITIVSGLPRSGTSLMMQMLVAGGMSALTDQVRRPDEDNPRGYYEWEAIKGLRKHPELILRAEGMVVKVVSELLTSLPVGPAYQVIFMERPLPEVLQSQQAMLRRRGRMNEVHGEEMAQAFREHLMEVREWLESRQDVAVCRIGYRRLLAKPIAHAAEIAAFLGIPLALGAMVSQVDNQLYRNRG